MMHAHSHAHQAPRWWHHFALTTTWIIGPARCRASSSVPTVYPPLSTIGSFGRPAEGALRRWLEVWESVRKADDDEPVFLNAFGTRLTDRSVRRVIDRWVDAHWPPAPNSAVLVVNDASEPGSQPKYDI